MERVSGQGSAPVVDKKSRDEYVDIPSYVEPTVPPIAPRQKLIYHGSGIVVGVLITTLAFAGWRYFAPDTPEHTLPAVTQQVASNLPVEGSLTPASNDANPAATGQAPAARVHHARANAGADVIAAAKPASGLMYVHRANSDLRPAPSTSSEPIKKLAKGEKVQLLALSDKWAQVDDAGTKGWVRASVIKDTPPGEKKARKKKADDE